MLAAMGSDVEVKQCFQDILYPMKAEEVRRLGEVDRGRECGRSNRVATADGGLLEGTCDSDGTEKNR